MTADVKLLADEIERELDGKAAARKFTKDDWRMVVTALRVQRYVGECFSPTETVELRKAIGELAMAMGNPAVQASGDQTIESQTIREALRRVKETVAAVRRMQALAEVAPKEIHHVER